MSREPTIADELSGQGLWHKVAGALVRKFCDGDARLDVADFAPLEGQAVVVSHENNGHTMRVRIMPQADADRLAEEFQRSARRKN